MSTTEDFWTRVNLVGEFLKIPGASIRKWKSRGWVPAKEHYQLSQNAKKAGTKLSMQELHDVSEAAKAASKVAC